MTSSPSSPEERTTYSFTQPVCETCWPAYAIGSRGHLFEPVRNMNVEEENCCFCGKTTSEGIYIRVDPEIAPFPSIAITDVRG